MDLLQPPIPKRNKRATPHAPPFVALKQKNSGHITFGSNTFHSRLFVSYNLDFNGIKNPDETHPAMLSPTTEQRNPYL